MVRFRGSPNRTAPSLRNHAKGGSGRRRIQDIRQLALGQRVDSAAWLILAALLPGSAGPPTLAWCLVPVSDVAIDHDSWNVSGLEGTGSKTVAISDPRFVPKHRVLPNHRNKTDKSLKVQDAVRQEFGRFPETHCSAMNRFAAATARAPRSLCPPPATRTKRLGAWIRPYSRSPSVIGTTASARASTIASCSRRQRLSPSILSPARRTLIDNARLCEGLRATARQGFCVFVMVFPLFFVSAA